MDPQISSSLFMNLTRLSNEIYPATEIIKYLIDVVGYDVVSFRRNAQVSYMLVDRAREICDAINGHIQNTESGGDWTSFEKFTQAIDPIENTLLKLIELTKEEKALYFASGESVEDCIISAERWVANREQIWDALDVLETRTELTNLFAESNVPHEADRLDARKHDDKIFFEEVIGDINKTISGFQRLPPFIRKLPSKLDQLRIKMATGSISLGLTALTVKTGLLMQGIVNISLVSTSVKTATRDHLRSTPVWEAARELVELLILTNGDDKASIENIRLKYEAFLRLLRNSIDLELPKSYIELLKLAGKVRRPFHFQAVALIQLCRLLATEFEKESHHTAQNVRPLEEACDLTHKALKEIVDTVTELNIFDVADLENHPAFEALATAQHYIKICFNAFGLDGDWSGTEQLISDAVEKDKERIEEVNRALTALPPSTVQRRAALVKVYVSVIDQTTSGLVAQVKFDIERSARLGAARWMAARGLDGQLVKRARQTGQFQLASNNTPCDLGRSVSDFTSANDECHLKLIFSSTTPGPQTTKATSDPRQPVARITSPRESIHSRWSTGASGKNY
ncbi:hypothetical protein BJV78DRAFT_1284237 [Lactifluus subvellereus]|nr:hypothetical protein BJV78DRAFT_1284237 [Lactifluus subvellereus]